MSNALLQEEMVKVVFQLNTLVVQPATLCNLNCGYCYLPDRKHNLVMPVSIASKIAEDLEALNLDHTVNILWHSGEPLVCGTSKFKELLEPFEALRKKKKIRHSIQTNGTLINKEWCDIFHAYNISVGVSIDGWKSLTANRVDWKGEEAYDRILHGIHELNESGLKYGVICVVTDQSISQPRQLYEFFCQLGCESVGFSIVEEEGVNKNLLLQNTQKVFAFWKQLIDAWIENPVVNIRELRRIIVWLESELNDKQAQSVMKDTLPSIAYNGDIVLVSPEFLGIKPVSQYETFVVGNILRSSLSDIIEDGLQSDYIKEYVSGMQKCRSDCHYFGYCRGGDASNKFFELGSLDTTRTAHCNHTKMTLIDAVMESL